MKTFIRFYVDSMTLESFRRIDRDLKRIIQYEELQIPENISFRVVSVERKLDDLSNPCLEYRVHYANNSEEEREDRTKGNRTYTDKEIAELLLPLN